MAKFQHKTHKHVVLMDGAPATEPWARFEDGVFETDDKKVIERLSALPDVEPFTEPTPAD
jgi:hypothetical protein